MLKTLGWGGDVQVWCAKYTNLSGGSGGIPPGKFWNFRPSEISLYIPVATASVERSFSQMKLIKTRLRSCLRESSLLVIV